MTCVASSALAIGRKAVPHWGSFSECQAAVEGDKLSGVYCCKIVVSCYSKLAGQVLSL